MRLVAEWDCICIVWACLVTTLTQNCICSSELGHVLCNYSPLADKPHFSVPHGRLEGNVYELLPYPLDITLNASVIGEIVVDCSATGYPEPSYTWQVNDGDINDSCVRVDFEEGGKV